jgi:hypothetical protein
MTMVGRALIAMAVLAPAAAADTAWYRGLIGRTATDLDTPQRYQRNKEVEMLLEVEGGRVTGRYFYFTDGGEPGADIPFQGTRDPQGQLHFDEQGEPERVTGRWTGSVRGGTFDGTWSDPAGKRRLPFFLRKLDDLSDTEVQVAPGMAYRPHRLIGTNVSLPFLTRFPDAAVLKKVNDAIRGQVTGARCDPKEDWPGWPDDHQVAWSVTYASPELLSVSIVHESFCGGAYPNAENSSVTFDLKTGAVLELADLFRDFDKDGRAILEILFGAEIKAADESCRGILTLDTAEDAPFPGLLNASFVFSLSKDTLTVERIGLPHVVQGCGPRVSAPLSSLRRFAAPGGVIVRILDSRPLGR